jgi:hypothetical protein
MNKLVLGTLPIEEAKRLQDQLKNKNITVFLDHNPSTCSRGCSVTVEASCYEKDIKEVSGLLNSNFKEMMADHDVKWELLNETFDPNKNQATCPACGTKFNTSSSECPDCGLCF